MDEQIRANEPMDTAEWAAIERRRKRVLVGAIIAVALLLVGAGVAAALLLGTGGASDGAAPTERVSETSGSIAATSGAVATASVDASASGHATAPAGPGVTPPPAMTAPVGVCMVAYRRSGWVCVAKPDGSGEAQLLKSPEGMFSLSPDAGTLAVVDAGTDTLSLVDLKILKVTEVGGAAQDTPAWGPDSKWLVYTMTVSGAPQVRRVNRDGSGAAKLFDGQDPAVSPQGDVIVGRTPLGAGSALVAWTKAGVERYAIPEQVTDVATDGGNLYFVQMGSQATAATLRRMDLGGHGNTVLRDSAGAARPISYHDLCISADGTYLSFAEWGDDGYSRLFSMTTGAVNKVTSLSIRRDDYPLCWGCDGRLYFIEGNALQGEATRLMAVRPDGLGRGTLVEGATR
ncbi:MAG: hypothetical protein WBI63_03980 [Coriobacteriia bacterium]